MTLFENTQAVRSERSRASGEVEEQAGRGSGGLRLRCATLRPNGQGSTASEKVYESFVVRFSSSRSQAPAWDRPLLPFGCALSDTAVPSRTCPSRVWAR